VTLILDANQLGSNAKETGPLPEAVFQNVLDGEILSNLVQAFVLFLVTHDRRSRDHTQLVWVEPAQLRNRLLGQAVCEILLAGITSEILEREYGEHDPIRWRRDIPEVSPRHATDDGEHDSCRTDDGSFAR